MDIERSQAAGHGAAATTQRHAHGGKAAAGGDFLALIASLQDGEGQGEPGLGLAGLLAAADAQPEALASPVEEEAKTLDPAAAGLAAQWLVDGQVPPATATAAVGAGALAGATLASAPVPVPDGSAAAAAALASRAGAVATGADAVQPGVRQRGAEAIDPHAGTDAQPAAAAPVLLDPSQDAGYASVFEQLRQHVAARTGGAAEATQRRMVSDNNALGAAPSTGRAGAVVPTHEVLRADRVSSASGLAGSGDSPTPAVPSTRLDSAPLAGVAAQGGAEGGRAGDGAGGWTGPDFTPTVQFDAQLSSLDGTAAAAADFEQQLADQLRHWVSKGVHSAELTLGTDDPVQVRIALDGNQAQVLFRSDEAATRAMLGNSTDQLRELLGAQGLVLSGVSVGTHSGGGAQGQNADGRGGSSARTSPMRREDRAIDTTVPAAAATPRSSSAVDLYV
jgi:flagellar hook-length control protein FliK